MAAHPKDLDPSESPRAFYGSELRRLREPTGLSQEKLGEKVFCSGAYISQIESAVRKPQLDMSQRLDAVLGSDGLLTRLCKLANRSKHAEHFADVAELEQLAETISVFAPTLVPGLLQTEAYARAVFEAYLPWASEYEVNKRVSARMDRARLLESETRPLLWVILHEFALRLPVGSEAVLREQLDHIASVARSRRALVQVLPATAGAHALMEGQLYMMTFADAPALAYAEGVMTGSLLDDPAVVGKCRTAYDLVRAAAMSPRESLAFIEHLAEEIEQ